MLRTQIYLPHEQLMLLKRQAVKEKSTVSKIIRNLIESKSVHTNTLKKQNAGDWLLSLARKAEKMGVKGPPDLATNMDKYLYGGE